MTAEAPAEPPWGALAPNALERTILRITAAAPRRGIRRAPASVLRRLMASWRPGPVDVEVYGFKARLRHAKNLADQRALFHPQHWDAAERALLAEIVTPSFRFLDVGASTGLYSLFVAARAGPQAMIVAVEPQPEVKDWLAFNIAANGFPIRHVDAAVAAGPGRARLTLPERNRGGASIVQRGARSVEVETVGLLELMDRFEIARADALKIDIEGAEDQALAPFFQHCPAERLPLVVIMESNARLWRTDCVEIARNAGYEVRQTTPMNTVLGRSA